MKTDKIVIIFDFDGVIVDSVSFLYEIYTDFLKEFGIKGNQEEFNLLNGPKLSEIVSFLKKKYHIQKDEKELLKIYQKKIASIYKNIKLNEDVENILKWLKHENITIALATSSKKEEVFSVLKKYGLEQYFDFIITGDDIKEAKPSPEIYNAVKNKYPNCEYYVIEDSENGLEAASSAGMKTIFYNPKENLINTEFTHTIHSLSQIKNIITEIKLNCFTIAKADNISLKVIEYELEINPLQREAIEKLWNDELKKRKLFNGNIVSYRSHKKNLGTLNIECFITQYKYFFAQLRNPYLNLNITPIGVSGIIIDEGNNTLLAVRYNVTEYNGYYELIPAGSIDSSKSEGSNILFQNQLTTEFEEETKISKKNINKIKPFCLILDKNHGVYDICSKIYINGLINNKLGIEQNEEYRNIAIMNLEEIKNSIANNFVPTSVVIYNNLE
jgi:HAD superfamily hydrolase (TIGR01509 family)